MDVEINPRGLADEYLANLNASFNGWGDAARFRWIFERTAGAPATDLMVLRDGARALAGSAVSYRNAVLANGRHERVGIMTGSWTLPAARGRGCFTRIIEESLELCRRSGAGLLLAFVTEDNASCRRLQAAGAVMVETSYWIVPPSQRRSPISTTLRLAAGTGTDVLHRAHESRAGGGLRFTYDLHGYAGQMLQRPLTTQVLESDHGLAIVEHAPGTDRLLALYPVNGQGQALVTEIGSAAHASGRTLFGFTGDAQTAAWFVPFDVAPRRGFMTIMAASGAASSQTSLCLENGDRM